MAVLAAGPDLEQHGGDGEHQRAEDQAGGAEQDQAADHREKGQHGVLLEPLADQDRPQQVVDRADHQHAPRGEDQRLAPASVDAQVDGGRQPDHERAEHRHHRQDGHHHAPHQRRRQAQPPEHQAAQGALHHRDGQRSVNRGMDGVVEPPGEPGHLGAGEGSQRVDRAARLAAIAQQEKEHVKGQAEGDQLEDRAGQEGARPFAEPGGDGGCRARQVELLGEAVDQRNPPRLLFEAVGQLSGLHQLVEHHGAFGRLQHQPLADEEDRHHHHRADHQHGDHRRQAGRLDPLLEPGLEGHENRREGDGPGERSDEGPDHSQAKVDSAEGGDQQDEGAQLALRGEVGVRRRRRVFSFGLIHFVPFESSII